MSLGETKKLTPPNCWSNLLFYHIQSNNISYINKGFRKLDMGVSKFNCHLIHCLSISWSTVSKQESNPSLTCHFQQSFILKPQQEYQYHPNGTKGTVKKGTWNSWFLDQKMLTSTTWQLFFKDLSFLNSFCLLWLQKFSLQRLPARTDSEVVDFELSSRFWIHRFSLGNK